LAADSTTRADGVIKARVALLDRNALGLDVTIFAHVKLATTGRDAIAEFEAAIRDRAEVLECYTLTGEWDFLLKIVTKNIKAYEAFYSIIYRASPACGR